MSNSRSGASRYFDPALMHRWEEVSPRGEWPTVDISPVCSPSVKRTVSTSDVPADGPMPETGVCPVCEQITEMIADRMLGVQR